MRPQPSRADKPRKCSIGKVRYRDRKSAKAALSFFKLLQQEDSNAHVPVRAYQCDECNGGYHLTSVPLETYVRMSRDVIQ